MIALTPLQVQILRDKKDYSQINSILQPLSYFMTRKRILEELKGNGINYTYRDLRHYIGKKVGLTKKEKRLLLNLKL